MTYWLMRMRMGWHGPDMFRKCRANGVAAIYYPPVEDTDLSDYSEDDLPPEWRGLEAPQSGSLRKVAWRIRGGDIIYVAESGPSRIVGVGRVKGAEGRPAYRFVPGTPIVDDDGRPWCHQIMVEWEQDFAEGGIRYPGPRAPQHTVLELNPLEVSEIKKLVGRNPKRGRNSGKLESRPGHKGKRQSGRDGEETDDEIRLRQLEESAYTRYTAEALKTIDRKHVKLCNAFTEWVLATRGIDCNVERRNIDVTFQIGKQSALVEFKVAYNGDPKPAIREALGQILEYNHYPDRVTYNQWILVLDCKPTEADRAFLKTIRKYGIPLSYGWQIPDGFEFSRESPLFLRVG